jgi:hypothetical protein
MPRGEWRVLGAPARFELLETDGGAVLVGRGPIPTNGFLASPREIADFRLSVDVRIGSPENPMGGGMNSGIQIRSCAKDGTASGLQIEIDPSPRAWSGGVYDERGRGWLASLESNEVARSAFRLGEWNRYEIECIGPRVRTRVNGIDAAEWYDGIVSGLLAFQVHGGPACEVAFRDPRIEELGRHEWIAGEAGACSLPPETQGVRFGIAASSDAASSVVIEGADGARIAVIALPAGDGRTQRTAEAVWLGSKGAVLVDGRRIAAIDIASRPCAARIESQAGAACADAVLVRRP